MYLFLIQRLMIKRDHENDSFVNKLIYYGYEVGKNDAHYYII